MAQAPGMHRKACFLGALSGFELELSNDKCFHILLIYVRCTCLVLGCELQHYLQFEIVRLYKYSVLFASNLFTRNVSISPRL